MDLGEYQQRASATDQRPRDDPVPNRSADALVIPLLGIGGELGELQAAYKKFLRDGDAYRPFRAHIEEELGDILWYVANLATKFELDLRTIARKNLSKVEDRWGGATGGMRRVEDLYDNGYADEEQLPRSFEVVFAPAPRDGRPEPLTQGRWNGEPFGDALGDNAYTDDGYRFHDVFHLAHCAILGWSPVCRSKGLFHCKRKSNPKVDAVEDGGRAAAIEEGIVAYVYGHARDHGYFVDVDAIDFAVLKTIKGMTADLEVRTRPLHEWQRAILKGYDVWRQVWQNDGGVVAGDILAATLTYRAL